MGVPLRICSRSARAPEMSPRASPPVTATDLAERTIVKASGPSDLGEIFKVTE
jgi:hypothetical protein